MPRDLVCEKATTMKSKKGKTKRRIRSPVWFERKLGPDWLERAHYSNISKVVTAENFYDCYDFIRACTEAARYEHKTAKIGGTGASFYLTELMMRLADAYAELIAVGDLKIAGHLPSTVEYLNGVRRKYKDSVRQWRKQRSLTNRFVGHLYNGLLWNNGVFTECPWHGRKDLPPKSDCDRWWTEYIKPFLREKFGKEPNDLTVFELMLEDRRAVIAKNPSGQKPQTLRGDKPAYQWSQIDRAIKDAMPTMACK
jgi:hypothetical protein